MRSELSKPSRSGIRLDVSAPSLCNCVVFKRSYDSRADGFEFLARSSRNDTIRNAYRISGDHVWTFRLVRRRARDHGLPDVRRSALSFAAVRNHVND